MRTHQIRTCRSRSFLLIALTLSVTSSTLALSASAAPPPGKGKPGSGDSAGTSCSYPAFADVPRLRLERRTRKSRYDNFRTADRYAPVRAIIDNQQATVTLLENGLLDASNWSHEGMIDPLNRSGNAGIDADGNLCEGCTPEGKRFSAWYENSSDLAVAESVTIGTGDPVDVLALGGEVAGLAPEGPPGFDPTRPGTDLWNLIRPRTTWLKTWERGQDGAGRWVSEGNLSTVGTHKFRAPLYLETRVNFSRMQTPGFRVSLWFMPATFEGTTFTKTETTPECMALEDNLLTNGCYSDPTPEFRSEAYDRNWKNGYEMDLFEFEPVDVIEIDNDGIIEQVVCGNAIEFSALNDYFGNRGNDTEYAVKNHFEGFEEGYCDPSVDYGDLSCDKTYANPVQSTDYLINDDVWHKIGFLWTETEVIWIFNDEIVLEIADPAKVPHPSVHQYLNLSREMTNGLSSGTIVPSTGADSYTTYLPAEPGLYGWNGQSNVGEFLENVADDRSLIRYIKVWDLSSP